jgi:hypothetical protein
VLKRWLSILLLSFILANVAGFYVYFIFRLKEIRSEMRAALKHLPEEKLQRISMTHAQYFTAQEETNEIEWQGFMYDVARVQTTADSVLVFALRDEAETNLLSFMQRMVDMAGQDEQTPPAAFNQFSALVFTLPAVMQWRQMATRNGVIFPLLGSPKILFGFRSIQTPPPWLA